MKPTFTNDSATIGTAEYSLPADSTSLAAQTDDCKLEVWCSLAAMAAGDQYRFRLYEKTNGGSSEVAAEWYREGLQPGPAVFDCGLVGEGWDFTVKKIAGTDRAIAWSLRKLVEGETVAAVTLAANAINAAATAADFTTEVTAALATAAAVAALQTSVDDLPTNAELATALDPIATAAEVTSAVAPLALSTQVDTLEASAATLATAIDALPTNAELATALSPLALSTQVDTLEASAASLATSVDALPTNAELATALDPIATAAEVSAAVAPLATSSGQGIIAAAIADLQADVDLLPSAAAIATAVWNATLDGAKTARGLLVRAHAVLAGKATGMLDELATFYRADGTTKAVEATQDPVLGTREVPSTLSGD